MAKGKRLLDIWIIESNTIYKEVPFEVVTDWIEQGRLLAEDKARLPGTEKWHVLGKITAMQPYFPKPDVNEADDQAEALASVESDVFSWSKTHDDEDDDVDMIPLIDISLVLLIFFLMTASVSSGVLSPIRTPAAKYQLATINDDMYWVGIDVKDSEGNKQKDKDGNLVPWYTLGKTTEEFLERSSTIQPVLKDLASRLDQYAGPVRVRIRADQQLPIEVIRAATLDLQRLQDQINRSRDNANDRITIEVSGEVSEPQ